MTAKIVIDAIEQNRDEEISIISKYGNLISFDILLPSIFVVVLADCKTPEDVLPAAVNIRNCKEATHFRALLKEVSAELIENRLDKLTSLLKAINDSAKLSKQFGSPKNVTINFGLGPLSTSVDIPVPKSFNKTFAFKNYSMTFISRLIDNSKYVRTLIDEIRRVFGNEFDISEDWLKFRWLSQ